MDAAWLQPCSNRRRSPLVCLDPDGRSNFNRLLYRRDWPFFYAFDLLWLNGRDVRYRPLLARKQRLRDILPRRASRVLYVDHVEHRGIDVFRAACTLDLEGIVAKWAHGEYLQLPQRNVS